MSSINLELIPHVQKQWQLQVWEHLRYLLETYLTIFEVIRYYAMCWESFCFNSFFPRSMNKINVTNIYMMILAPSLYHNLTSIFFYAWSFNDIPSQSYLYSQSAFLSPKFLALAFYLIILQKKVCSDLIFQTSFF